jgi:hypothetical protein
MRVIDFQATHFGLRSDVWRTKKEPSHSVLSTLKNGSEALLIWLICGFGACTASALTLAELQSDLTLTPEGFVRLFSGFAFKLGEEVQRPEVFLAQRSGDCDDFATLAAEVLRARGYTTRLVVVHLRHETHVVCYVSEVKAYLDYNLRKKDAPLVTSDGSLKDIAIKVAAGMRDDWYAVSEFTFCDGIRRITATELP